MKKIVLTGANGFLGSTITTQALAQGKAITPLVRSGSSIDLLKDKDSITYIDYNNRSELEQALSGHHILIHNAGLTRALNWDSYKAANIDLTSVLIEIFNRTASLEQFIFISSQAAAGPSTAGKPLKETCQPQPVSLYGKSKLQAEDLVRTRIQGNWTIIRPASVYGPGDKDFLQLYKLIKKHIMIYPITKEKIFSLIYSEDLARLILSCVANEKAYDQLFFAANPEPIKQTELTEYLEQIMTSFSNQFIIPGFWVNLLAETFDLFGRITGKLTVINRERMREFSLSNWQVNSQKAQQMLDFEPEFEIYEALHKTWQWYVQEGWL